MADVQDQKAAATATLKDRYRIHGDRPLPDFTTGTAQAFVAEDAHAPGDPMMALLVNPGIPYRADALRILKGIDSPGLMTLVDYGAVQWPPYQRKVMAIVYERPLGGRVMAAPNSDFARIEPNELIKKVVSPIARALRKLAEQRLTHRAIRPTNLYWTGQNREGIVLGDCAAAPPGFDQPIVMETVESALTHPAGRGNGRGCDDIYALGIALVMLILGRNPLAAMAPAEIIRAKIADGSYETITGRENVPIHLIDMLRGLLNDDPDNRWTPDELDQWLGGKRLTVPMRADQRAAYAFEFRGKEYHTAREVAIALAADWGTAIAAVADGRLEQWLRRALGAREMADGVVRAISERAGAAADQKSAGDVMLCKVCLYLDRLAPIRYKSVAVMPDGIGALLAMTIANEADVNPVVELFVREVERLWLDTHPTTREKKDEMVAAFSAVRGHLRKTTIGDGIERVLYSLCESIPCQSPYVANDFVATIRDLLPALEAAALKPPANAWPVDRHVAAFAAVRATFDVNRQMVDIADPSAQKSALGMLNLLATIQWHMGQKDFVKLAGWVAGLVKPIIEGYLGRRHRRELEREVPRVAQQGDLVALFRLLDDPERRNRDFQEYAHASAQWHEMAAQISEIDAEIKDHGDRVADLAQKAAALVSFAVAGLTVLALAAAKH